jgi:dolichol-phosphate mannosyltransferase
MNREVPEYRTFQFGDKRNIYCICVYVINEGRRIRDQLMAMESYSRMVDIIIADGGSTDNSLAPVFLKERGVTALLVKKGPGFLSAQMRMSFDYALNRGYQGVITIDGNGKDDPGAIPLFIAALDRGEDHIQGSRFIAGGKSVNLPLQRRLGIKLLHAPLIRLASGYRYTDTTNGFRAYSRRLLEDRGINVFRDVFTKYELHYYLAIKAAKLNYRVSEVPVVRTYPATSEMPTKISPLKGNLLILATLLKAVLGRYDVRPE